MYQAKVNDKQSMQTKRYVPRSNKQSFKTRISRFDKLMKQNLAKPAPTTFKVKEGEYVIQIGDSAPILVTNVKELPLNKGFRVLAFKEQQSKQR